MIETGTGNLLLQDVDALVNTVNTVGVMGKGVALQFKRAFPTNYRMYRAAADRGEVRLGEMFVFDSGQLGPRRYIINFPTKGHWRSPSRLDDIRAGLRDLVRRVQELELESIALPALGCGNGGLSWDDVRPLIDRAFVSLPDVRVVVFPPAGAPAPHEMPVATPRPQLDLERSVLLVALSRYLDQARSLEQRDDVSELETQKLVYFLQILGLTSQLEFARGRYGPYAELLHPLLQELEGHQLCGYGDRSAHVTELRPLRLTDGALAEASGWLAEHAPGASERIDDLMTIVAGFETPYSLELLATAHYAAHVEPATHDAELVSERVAGWNLRKARLFTEQHVSVAMQQLQKHGLVAERVGGPRPEI